MDVQISLGKKSLQEDAASIKLSKDRRRVSEADAKPQINDGVEGLRPSRQKRSESLASRGGTLRGETNKEKKFVESQFVQNGDRLLYIKWLENKTEKGKYEDILFAVGNYRILTVRKALFGKNKISDDGHFFELEEISSPNNNEINLIFKSFTLELIGDDFADEVLFLMIPLVKKITQNFPNQLRINVEPQKRLEDMQIEDFESSPDAGFLNTYRACCNFYHMPINLMFIHFAEELISFNKRPYDLVLNNCEGIDPKSSLGLDLQPIAAALRFTPIFKSLILKDIPRKEAVSAFAMTIAHNTKITNLVLSNLEAEPESFITLGEALKKNENISLTSLDLSKNKITDKGIVALITGIEEIKTGLNYLDLSNCEIEPKGIEKLMKTLDSFHAVSTSIQKINISGNNCGPVGTLALSDWISNMKQGEKTLSNLKSLCLSGCQLDIFSAFQALTSSLNETLRELDISNNKITSKTVEFVCEFLKNSESIQNINFSSCSLTPELAQEIINSINKNERLDAVQIDFSKNDLGEKGAKAIAMAIRYSKTISSIDLRSNTLKKEGMIEVVKAIGDNANIKRLNLSDNNKSTKNSDLIKAITQLLIEGSELEILSISGNLLGKELVPFLTSLGSNKKLVELDVSDNNFGDQGAEALSISLKSNTTLRTLHMDGNSVTFYGFNAIRESFKHNRTLYKMEIPQRDVAKATTKIKGAEKEKIQELMEEISICLLNNKP